MRPWAQWWGVFYCIDDGGGTTDGVTSKPLWVNERNINSVQTSAGNHGEAYISVHKRFLRSGTCMTLEQIFFS